MMEESGILDAASLMRQQLNKKDDEPRCRRGEYGEIETLSESTIYKKAVQSNCDNAGVLKQKGKRGSASSDEIEQLDTSDETNGDLVGQIDRMQINDFITTGAEAIEG